MRPIGFSTGALAYADFRRGLQMMRLQGQLQAIELSALRQNELLPLLDAIDSLDLTGFADVSIHAPSQFDRSFELQAWQLIGQELWRGWPIIIHPDAITEWPLWREFASLVCIENMDKRKPVGRTAKELDEIFTRLPEASFCFDIGHARQCDPTMTEALIILREFGSRLRQIHVSEVNTRSKHDPLSYGSIIAFQEVAHLIPEFIPLILETPVEVSQMAAEIANVRKALPLRCPAVA
jgi:hypothetical protein